MTVQVVKEKMKRTDSSIRQVTFESASLGANSEDFEEIMIEEPSKSKIVLSKNQTNANEFR